MPLNNSSCRTIESQELTNLIGHAFWVARYGRKKVSRTRGNRLFCEISHMEIICRKRTETDIWHICVDCTAWRTRNYTEKWVELTSIDPSTICIQCLQRKRDGKCRLLGPHRFHGLDCELAYLCGSLIANELQLLGELWTYET